MFSTCQIFFHFPPFFSSLENRGFGSLFVRFFFFLIFFFIWRGRFVEGLPPPAWLLWLPEAVTHAHLLCVALLTKFI